MQGEGFAGTPFVILGQNKHIAWGATTNPMDVTDTYIEQVRPDPTSPSGLSTVYEGALEHIVPIPETFRLNARVPGATDTVVPAPPGSGRARQTLIVPRRNNGPIVSLRRGRRHRAVRAVRRLLGDPRARHVPALRPARTTSTTSARR